VENSYSRTVVTAVEDFNLFEPLRDTLQLQLDSPIVLAKQFGSGSDTKLFARFVLCCCWKLGCWGWWIVAKDDKCSHSN
jgi:hypothetical protein